jgi:hypothetical protein
MTADCDAGGGSWRRRIEHMHRVPRHFNDEVVDEIAPGVDGLGPNAGSPWLEVPVAQFRHQFLGLTCIESL